MIKVRVCIFICMYVCIYIFLLSVCCSMGIKNMDDVSQKMHRKKFIFAYKSLILNLWVHVPNYTAFTFLSQHNEEKLYFCCCFSHMEVSV